MRYMKNPIAERISDFLKNYPPFSKITYPVLLEVANASKVVYLEKNETLFKINDAVHDVFYVVATGAVGLTITSDNDDILIDKCDEGDILGLRPFFAEDNYLMHAKAREDAILYAIPISVFKPIVANNSKVLHFLLQSFASNTRNPYDAVHKGKLITENIITNVSSANIQYFQPIKYTINPVTAKPNDIVKHIAQKMSDKRIGSIIVEENNLPIGIITDKDLRSKIATGLHPITTPIHQIMSFPVITVTQNLSIAEAQIMMLKNNVGHLCVTTDGSMYSAIIGIISEHDIVVAQANNPGVLLKQIQKSKSGNELKMIREKITDFIQNALDKKIPINHICSIVGELNSAITRKAIELSVHKMQNPPPTSFAWLNIGSQGRKEQLLLTDQDNAIIFENVAEDKLEMVKAYFITLAKEVTAILNVVGYEYCPANMMASNPLWCKSLNEWHNQFKQWIHNPGENGILMTTIFFDYDFVYGDDSLVNALTDALFAETHKNDLFFAYLGADALKNPPPLGFFRQFLVENDGEHKDDFDIKLRALMPLIDAARILSLHKGFNSNTNTSFRYTKLAELEPQNASIYEACKDAFLELLKFRTEEGIQNNSNGRFLNLKELSKLDRVKLKNTFQPITDIQEVIKNRFQLTYFT